MKNKPNSTSIPSIETWSYSDKPIRKKDDDQLDRFPFAKQVANLIGFNQTGLNIIGLYGEWGEGKTSALNMALDEYKDLMKQSAKEAIIVHFFPWEYSAQTNLVKALFSTIAQQVQTSHIDPEKKEAIVQGLIVVSDLVSVYCSYRYPGALPAIKAVKSGIKQLVKRVTNEPSLEEEKEKLKKALNSSSCRIIIVIDDVDRLLHPEIRELVRAVKANGDLPNLTWILLCDRAIVAKAVAKDLDSDEARFGHQFLDKIIPIGLDLPKVSRDALFAKFQNLLGNAFQSVSKTAHTDLLNDPMESVRLFCTNMRNVKRLVNSILISLRMLQAYQGNNGCPSIHFGDFINLEAWRLFNPEFYHAVFQNKDTLLTTDVSMEEEWFEMNLLNKVPKDHHEKAWFFIKERLNWSTDVSSSKTTRRYKREGNKTNNRYRISSSESFDVYFSYRMNNSGVLRAEEEQLIQSADNSEKMLQHFLHLNQNGKLSSMLHILEDPPVFKTEPEALNYLFSLWSLAERIDSNKDYWKPSLFNYSRQTRIMRCSLFFLKTRYQTSIERFHVIEELMSDNPDIISQPLYLVAIDHAHYKRDASVIPLLEKEQFDQAKRICLERLEKIHANGSLSTHPNSFEIRRQWRVIAGAAKYSETTKQDWFRVPDAYDNLTPFTSIHERAEGVFHLIDINALERECDVERLLRLFKQHSRFYPQFSEMVEVIYFAFTAKKKHLPYDDETLIQKVLEMRASRIDSRTGLPTVHAIQTDKQKRQHSS